MLAKAAAWSPKNIAPVRLIATSNAAGSNGWTCASARRKCGWAPLGLGEAAGDVEHPRRQVHPEGEARGCAAGGVAGGLAGAAAEVEHRVGGPDPHRVEEVGVVRGDRGVERSACRAQ